MPKHSTFQNHYFTVAILGTKHVSWRKIKLYNLAILKKKIKRESLGFFCEFYL